MEPGHVVSIGHRLSVPGRNIETSSRCHSPTPCRTLTSASRPHDLGTGQGRNPGCLTHATCENGLAATYRPKHRTVRYLEA